MAAARVETTVSKQKILPIRMLSTVIWPSQWPINMLHADSSALQLVAVSQAVRDFTECSSAGRPVAPSTGTNTCLFSYFNEVLSLGFEIAGKVTPIAHGHRRAPGCRTLKPGTNFFQAAPQPTENGHPHASERFWPATPRGAAGSFFVPADRVPAMSPVQRA
jgi:hypothetical protein